MTPPGSLQSDQLFSTPSAAQSDRAETELCFYSGTLNRLYAVANAAFVNATGANYGVPPEHPTRRTQASTTADPDVVASTADAPALRALEQLRGWLNLSYEQLGQVVGLNASVIHHWRRRHRLDQPVRVRASSVERLWRVHSILRAVSEALDGDDSGYGVQMWARSAQADEPAPLDLLISGRIDDVERLARRLLFDQSPRRPSSWRLVAPEVEDNAQASDAIKVDYGEDDFG